MGALQGGQWTPVLVVSTHRHACFPTHVQSPYATHRDTCLSGLIIRPHRLFLTPPLCACSNHVTRASQWAAQTTDPSIPSIPLDKLPYLLGRGAPSTSSVENPEATGYGHVESSHACVDFTRATSSAHPSAHGYMHKETEAWESEASEVRHTWT